MYIVANIPKGKISTSMINSFLDINFTYCIDLCITYPFLTGPVYLYLISVLKAEMLETNHPKTNMLIFSFLIEKYLYLCYNGNV